MYLHFHTQENAMYMLIFIMQQLALGAILVMTVLADMPVVPMLVVTLMALYVIRYALESED
jgi:hypothetical protein